MVTDHEEMLHAFEVEAAKDLDRQTVAEQLGLKPK
jgi:hypothetical protein